MVMERADVKAVASILIRPVFVDFTEIVSEYNFVFEVVISDQTELSQEIFPSVKSR